jgi:hypothetical protein
MAMKSPKYIADFDSSSGMLRAVSSFLRGEDFPALGQRRVLEPFAMAANLLPPALRRKVYILGGWQEALPPRKVDQVDSDAIAEWVTASYPHHRYPAVAIGSSNGAATHLWSAMGVPWLPQTMLVPIRQSVDPDKPRDAMQLGLEPGRVLLENNPDVQLHHMHDANQDRLMVRAMTYYRIKRRKLGEAYRQFIEQNLPAGGTIFVVDCEFDWSVTRVGDRHVFQHGALGGAREEEFHEPSERVRGLLDEMDASVDEWDEPERHERAPEAEWGFEPELMDDIEALARRRHYRIRRISFPEPESFSPMVADLYRWWYAQRGIPSNRLVVSSFVLLEPWWTLRTGSVPFWMVFNMEPSRRALNAYLDGVDPFDEIHLMLFSHGIDAVGLPSADDWLAVLDRARRKGDTAGIDPEAFPADFASFARYHHALKALPARHAMPAPLSLEQLDTFLEEAGDRYDIRWRDVHRPVPALPASASA